jgi:hypothetical protein
MFIAIIFTFLSAGRCTPAKAQNYYEGTLDYRNTFIDKKTFLRLFEDVFETIAIKGAKYRINIYPPSPGQVYWEIADFESGKSFEFKNYSKQTQSAWDSVSATHNSISVHNDSAFILQMDAALTAPPDSVYAFQNSSPVTVQNDSVAAVASAKVVNYSRLPKIFEKELCLDSTKIPPFNKKTFTWLRMLDTTMVVAGLNCKILEVIKDEYRVAEYYYCDSIKIDPAQYACRRADGDSKIYKFTNGSLITKRVIYDMDEYIYVQELQCIDDDKVLEEVFKLPAGTQVVSLVKQ